MNNARNSKSKHDNEKLPKIENAQFAATKEDNSNLFEERTPQNVEDDSDSLGTYSLEFSTGSEERVKNTKEASVLFEDDNKSIKAKSLPSVQNSSITLFNSNRRICWICLDVENESDDDDSWVHPCKCKGSSGWVHQNCIGLWVAQKQGGDMKNPVSCPQCNTRYVIKLPQMSTDLYILDKIGNVICKLCPHILLSIGVGSLYWTLIVHGAVTVVQILGVEDGLDWIRELDIGTTVALLPIIPLTLTSLRVMPWEEFIVFFTLRERLPDQELTMTLSATRMICEALFLPTIAVTVGSLLYPHETCPVNRALLGGFSYILLSGLIKCYYKRKLILHLSRKIIQNFNEYSDESEEISDEDEFVMPENGIVNDEIIFHADEDNLQIA